MVANQKRVTMQQIADCFGVSAATVSLALRNHPRISQQLRTKIQKKANELGYHPDPMLTILAHYRHTLLQSPVRAAIAWINCWSSPKELRGLREFNAYWKGASEAAEKFGYRLEEFIVNKEMPMRRLQKILITRNIKGIVLPPHRLQPDWEDFDWNHFSVVRLGRSVRSPEMHVITSDQAANTIMALREVTRKGYERVGYVGANDPVWMFASGFLQEQLFLPKNRRIPPLVMPLQGPTNQALFQEWVKKNRPDAIITTSPDLPAMLTALNYKLPDDVALAGLSQMDGNISAGIDQHSEEVGRVAVLTVISLINDFAQGTPGIFRQILVEGTWVDGPSMPDKRKA
jgi:LacI family transcriptional regulator